MEERKQSPMSWFIAFITCPCHLFILLPLVAGTALGAFLNAYLIPVAIILGIIFIISFAKAIKGSKLDKH